MINNAVLVGRLTKNAEVKKTPSGVSVSSFTLAVDRRHSAEKTTDFINCVAWRQAADFLGSYGRKGNIVGIEGEIQTRNYKDQQGKTVYITEVVAREVRLIGNTKKEEPQETTQKEQEQNWEELAESGLNVTDEDLPF